MNKNHLRTNPNPNPKQCEEKYLFLNKAFQVNCLGILKIQ